jgi:hypothetical protein
VEPKDSRAQDLHLATVAVNSGGAEAPAPIVMLAAMLLSEAATAASNINFVELGPLLIHHFN